MNPQEPLFESVSKTIQIINKKYGHLRINAGGCGIFARLMARALKSKGCDISFVLTFGNWNKHEADISNSGIHSNDFDLFMGTSWRHILLKANDFFIDSSGVYKSDTEYFTAETSCNDVRFSDEFQLSTLDHMLSKQNRWRWNNSFNRAYASPISKLITKHLEM